MNHHSPMLRPMRALLLRAVVLFGFVFAPMSIATSAQAQDGDSASAPGKRGRKGKRKGRRRGKGKRKGKKGRQEAPPAEAEASAVEPDAEVSEEAPSGDDGDAEASGGQGRLEATPQGGSLRRSNKMEFDARLVRGETAGTGAVVLFDRGQRELPALTSERSGFLRATLEEVYGPGAASTASRAQDRKRGRARRARPSAPDAAMDARDAKGKD